MQLLLAAPSTSPSPTTLPHQSPPPGHTLQKKTAMASSAGSDWCWLSTTGDLGGRGTLPPPASCWTSWRRILTTHWLWRLILWGWGHTLHPWTSPPCLTVSVYSDGITYRESTEALMHTCKPKHTSYLVWYEPGHWLFSVMHEWNILRTSRLTW